MKSFRTLIAAFVLGLACCGTLQAQEWLTNGLVAFYPFDENTVDASGNAINGTGTNVALTADRLGFPARALFLRGTNGSFMDMGVPISLQFGGDFTIGAWVKVSQGDADARILSYGGDLGYELVAASSSSNRQFQFNFAGCSVVSQETYPSNEWHFVAAQCEGPDARLYVDGVCVGTNAPSVAPAYAGNLYLGRSGSGDYWGGALDQITFYDRALSSNELADLMASGPVTQPIFTWRPTYVTNDVLTSLEMNVEALGLPPVFYRVLKYDGTKFVALDGQTNGMLALTNLMTNDAGTYIVEAKNDYGTRTNGVMQLTVKRLPQYITYFQPLPTNAVVGDPPITLAANSSSGLPVRFQVLPNPYDPFPWDWAAIFKIATVTGNTLNIMGTGTVMVGAFTTPSDIYDGNNGMGFNFSVGGAPLGINEQPSNQLVNVGANVSFSLSAVGSGPLAYEWKKQESMLGTNIVISSVTNIVTTSNYPSPPPASGVQTNLGYVTVATITNPVPYGTITNLIIGYATNNTYPISNDYYCTPQKLPHSTRWVYCIVTGTNYTYPKFTYTYPVIAYSTNSAIGIVPYYTTLQNGVTASNMLNASSVLTNVQQSDAGKYLFVITNRAGAVTSSIVTLTVNQLPVAAPDYFVCKGTSPLKISVASLLQNDSDPDGDVLSLFYSGPFTYNQGTAMLSGAFIYYTPPAGYSNATDQFDYAIRDGRNGIAVSTVTIRFASPPTLTGTMLPEGFQVMSSDAVAGVTYLLQAGTNTTATVSWQTIGTNVPASDGPIQFLDSDATNLPARLYRVLMP